MKEYFAPSELIINEDGSVFHLHLKPEQLADKVILVGDPGRVALVASHFDTKDHRFIQRKTHNGNIYRNRMRQYRHRDERTGCLGQYRFRHKI